MVLTFKVPPELAAKLREHLEVNKLTLAQFMREAVERRLGAGPGLEAPAQAPPEQGTRADASASVAKSSLRRKPKSA